MSIKVAITIVEGPNKGESYEFDEGTRVMGRNRGDFKLNDKKVSGRHCQFMIEGDKLIFEDLGSTNGSFIGSKKIEGRLELSNLDVLTVGLSRISVAIVEDVQKFKQQNSLEWDEEQENLATRAADSAAAQEPPEAELPDDDAEYRDTGVNRIDNLIEDELQAFSKWDHPNVAESGKSGSASVPKVKVILTARKAPEGVSQIICSDGTTSIGRKGVDIRINDLDLSRKHASIEIVAGTQVYVRDLASTNGTYVNGNRVAHQALKNGDLLQLGQSVFEVLIQKNES